MRNLKKTAATASVAVEMGEVRVVHIEYHHIQTDASNFKSVVQSLTGKHSSVVEGGVEKYRKRQRVVAGEDNYESIININIEESGKLVHTASFKDLDRLLSLNLPSMEDLNWIWTD